MQVYVRGLQWPGVESGWCFVSKSVGVQLCPKGDMDVGSYSRNLMAREPSWKPVGLPPTVNIMWIAPI